MKSLIQTIALWTTLAGLSWIITAGARLDAAQILVASGLVVLPALGVWLTALATPSQERPWFLRLGFWMVTVVAWFAVVLFAHGRGEVTEADEQQSLLTGFGLALGVAVWIGVKKHAFPKWTTLRDVAASVVVLGVAGSLFVWSYDAKTRTIAAQAEARWTEIGLPMAEYEKTLTSSHESAGSKVVRQVLREFVQSRFYKEGTAAADREPPIVYSEDSATRVMSACNWVGFNGGTSDKFEYSKEMIVQAGGDLAFLEPIAPALNEAYRRILATEPAVWAANPVDGYTIDVPNFLGIRRFSLLAASDAVRRFSAGDSTGAARALAAGMRLTEKLPEHPTLVALMIRVATDALFVPKTVRLPAMDDGFTELAQDVATKRAQFLRCLQIEAWIRLRQPEQFSDPEMAARRELGIFPKWVKRIANPRLWRRDTMNTALNYAEHVNIRKSPDTQRLPDFGGALHETVSTKNPTASEINVIRSAMRIHATLLLREQTELIRQARAHLAAGLPVESRESLVLPATRWDLIGDAQKNTITTRLVNAPEWIVKNTVTGNGTEFWVLPIDGSGAWQFRPPARTVSE